MIAEVASIESVAVESEAEALLAEQGFIKQYRPRFNIRLRDDKSYPFIGISLDEDANESARGDSEISASSSSVRVHVVTAREDVVVARAVRGMAYTDA